MKPRMPAEWVHGVNCANYLEQFSQFKMVCRDDSNNNTNTNDNVYGAVIMARPLREFTRFI